MAIIGTRNYFVHARQWYLKLASLERQVCRIELASRFGTEYSTGFLVGPDVVLTTYHTLERIIRSTDTSDDESSISPQDVVFRFDYIISTDNHVASAGIEYRLTEMDWLLDSSPAAEDGLDYALVQISNAPGLSVLGSRNVMRGWIEIPESTINLEPGSPMSIVQHPSGMPMQIAIDTHGVVGFNSSRTRILYRTNTEPGSSGAPCFDINWKLIAMHHARDVRSQDRNEGIPIDIMVSQWKQRGIFDKVSQEPPIRIPSPEVLSEFLLEPRDFALEPGLRELIAQGESQLIEFKERIHHNTQKKHGDTEAHKNIVKTIAGFMNSEAGGTLIIGITDNGAIMGIDKEYEYVDKSRPNWDGYSLFLNNLLMSSLDIENAYRFYSITRFNQESKDLCVIYVKPTNRPVWVHKKLFLRVGNQTIELQGRDLVDYIDKLKVRTTELR